MAKSTVEIFSGHGLGLSNSSLEKVGSVFPVSTIGQAQLKCFVNVNNGNLVLQDHIVEVIEENFPLHFGYIYNSHVLDGDTQHWRLALTKKIFLMPDKTHPNEMIIEDVDGHLNTLTFDATRNVYLGEMEANGRAIVRFDEIKNQWIWYHSATQMVEIYNMSGQLISRADSAGRATSYEYQQGEISAVVGPTGNRYEIRRGQNEIGKTVEIFEILNGLETLLHAHQFDQLDRLKTTTPSVDGYAINYSYVGDTSEFDLITQDDGTVLMIGSKSDKVTSVEVGGPQDNHLFRYDIQYESAGQPTIVTDSQKIPTNIYVDNNANIAVIEKAKGYTPADTDIDTTVYEYTDNQLTKITFTDSSVEKREYEPTFGLLTKKHKQDGGVVELYYDNTDRPKLETSVDYLSADKPLVTRFVYDNNWDKQNEQHTFLRYKILPSGSVIENRADKRGNVETQRQFLDKKYLEVSNLPKNIAPSLGAMNDWVNTQSADKISLKKCGYDLRGQLQLTATYANIDEHGNGIEDEEMSFELTQWNRNGNWLQKNIRKEKNESSTTLQRFDDSLNRLTKQIQDPQGLAIETGYSYDDKKQIHSLVEPNGRTTLTTLNAMKAGINSIQTAVGEATSRNEKIISDSDGRPVKHFMTDGKITYDFYNKEQMLGFTVSRTGIVVEIQHDTKNRFQKTIEYHTRIDPAQMYLAPPKDDDLPNFQKFKILLNQIKNNDKNRESYKFFDPLGRLRYTVNARSFIVETRYDALGQKIATIEYSQPLSDQDLLKLKQKNEINLIIDFSKDRVHQTIYTVDGVVLADIDAAGYVTQQYRDAANRTIMTRQFATRIKPENRSIDSNISFMLPPASIDDGLSYYFRDARGQIIYQVNADGSMVYNEYLACGKLSKQRQFVNKVDDQWFVGDKKLPPIVQETENDLVIQIEYDVLLREENKHFSNERCDHTEYNNMGQKTLSKFYDTTDDKSLDPTKQQRTQTQYDGWGQSKKEANRYVSQLMLENPDRVNEIWDKNTLRNVYDGTGLKLKTIDPLNATTVYFYDDERRPLISVNPLGVVSENTLNSFGEIETTRTYATKLTAEQFNNLSGGIVSTLFLSFLHDQLANDKDHVVTQLRNKLGQVYQSEDAESNISTFDHNAFGEISEENLPLDAKVPSIKIIHEYEPRGMESKTTKTAGEIPSVIEKKEYQHFLGKQTSYTDPTGYKSSSKYDKVGNLQESINGLEITTKSIVRDGRGRVKTENDAYGNSVQHQYDEKQRTQTTIYPVQSVTKKLTRDIFDNTIQSINAAGQLRAWSYDAGGEQSTFKNAHLRESKKIRDLNGHLTDDVDHNGIVTKNSLDFLGNIKGITQNFSKNDTSKSRVTTNQFDAFNQKEQVTNNRGLTTLQEFFKNGGVKKITVDSGDPSAHLNLITQNTYNAQNAMNTTMIGDVGNLNQYDKKILTDSLGRQIAEIADPAGLALTTQSHLDLTGRTIANVDAMGFITRFFYDAAGNERFKIGPRGDVTETVYDKNSRPVSVKTYENKIDIALSDNTTLLEVINAMSTKSSLEDSIVWTFYDTNGREVYKVNSAGAVQENIYDNASKVINVIKYYQALDPVLVPGLNTGSLSALIKTKADPTLDRKNYTMYDDAGRERILIDACGFATLKDYDDQGNLITVSCFATKIANPSDFARLSMQQAISSLARNKLRDRITYHVYNEFNEPIFEVDPEGGVTRYDHDAVGNQTLTNRYNDRILSLPASYADLVVYLKTQLSSPTNDNSRITEKVYDNANRVNETKDEYQKSDIYGLDALGQSLTHTDRMKQTWTYKFDRAKRNTHEITPKVDVTFITQDNSNGALLKDSIQNINIVTRTEFDNNSNKTLVVIGDGTTQARPMINHFNEANNLTGVQLDNIAVNDETKNADFVNRPEKIVTVNTQKIYNMKNKVVVDVNQSGEATFHVYDAANREAYLVSQKKGVVEFKRNAFGEVEEQVSYNTPIEIDLAQYQSTGIPLSVLKPLIRTSKADRYEKVKYDAVGNKICLQKGPVSSYSCTGASSLPNFQENTYSDTSQDFNAFKEVISQTVLMDPIANTKSEHLTWYDRNGKELVTAVKSDVNAAKYFIVRKIYNRFNQECTSLEYELPISANLDPNTTTVEEIDNLVKANPSLNKKDRKTTTEYNRAGSKKTETKCDVAYQELVVQQGSKPTGKSVRDNLSVAWEYDDMQRPIVKINEDGQKEYTYYDETGVVVARVDIERETQNEAGQLRNTVPLTLIGHDVAGQEVKQVSYYNGTTSPDITKMPTPLLVDPDHDQVSLALRGSRGEIRVKQDPEKILKGFTYTLLREKIARNFNYMTNYAQKSPTQYVDVKAMDEERLFYDEMNFLKETWSVRNGNAVYKKTNTVNLFGDVIAEALDGKAPYLYRKFDNTGRLWLSNAYNHGVHTIVLHDLAGNETCKIDSESINLSTKTYDDLSSIINLPAGQIDKNETIYDARGHATTVFEPETTNITSPFSLRENTVNDLIPLSMIVKTENGSSMMSWVLPQERIFLPSFKMWPSKDASRIYQPELQYADNRVFIDLSKAAQGAPLPTDVYCYSMVFSLKDPSTGQSRNIFETTGLNEGKIQIDTGINTNSLSLVAIVNNQNTLKLSGNITNLTAVELYQNGALVATLPLTQPAIDGAYQLSLKTYETGEYTIKGVRNGVVDDTDSLVFKIFTSKVRSDVPVIYEIPLKLSISTLDEYGQMVLELPDEFTRKNVKLTVNYTNEAGDKKSEEIPIADPSFFEYYFPGDGMPGFSYNFKLTEKIKQINSVDLKIQKIDDQWLQLLSGAEPTKTLEVLPPPQKKILSSYDKQLVSNIKCDIKNDIENPNILISNFSLRQIIHVENWSDMTEEPEVVYLDMTKDRLADQHSLDIIGYTKNDITFDISGMQPGAYPFTINNTSILENQHFTVFGGGQVYPCDNYYNYESRFDTYLKAMKLGLLATRAKRDETLSGQFNDGRHIQFKELYVKPDGDCGFNALAIPSKNGKKPREYFRDFLVSLKDDRYVREQMASEIRGAFLIPDSVYPPDQTHWQILHRRLDEAASEKNKFRARITRELNLQHLEHLEELEFNKHLKERDWDKYFEFNCLRLAEINADQDIMRYCTRQDVYLHYVNAYSHGMWMGFESALVYAKKNNFTLHIWSRDRESKILRYENGHDAGEVASNTIHMLQTDGGTHFNLLHVIDGQNKKDITHELLRRANLVANNNRRTREFQRDAWNNITAQTDPEGNTTRSEYDHNNSLNLQESPPVVVLKNNTISPLPNPVSLSTKWGFNKRGFNIYKEDPKGNIEGYLLNKANQMLSDILPDGTTSLAQALDVFANQVVYKDTEGNQYLQKFNRNRQLVQSTMPGNGGNIFNIYGENQLLRGQSTTGGNTARYNYGVNGDVTDSFLPAGQHTQMDYDPNHKLKNLVNPDPSGGSMSWNLDDFGNILTHTNLSNITFQTERDFKNQPIHIFQSAGTNPEPNWGLRTRFGSRRNGLGAVYYFFWQSVAPVPGQNLRFKYDGGRLVELQDVTNGKTSWYTYNQNNDKINIRVKGTDNELIQEISTRYDALRREIWSFDTMCICETWFDENGNRTRLQSQVFPFGPTLPPLVTNGFNTFGPNNEQIYDLGVWDSVNNQVTLGVNQGIRYIYDVNSRRKRQEYIDQRGLHSVTLGYYPSGLLKSTSVAGGVNTSYGYNADYQLNYYSQTNPPGSQNISSSVSSSINVNGWTNSDTQIADSYNDDHEHITSTTVTTFSQVRGTGDPNHQVNNTHSYNHHTDKSSDSTDDINRKLIGMDAWKLKSLSVTRSNKYGRNSSIASNYYDSNGQIVAQLGVNDPDNDDPENPSSINYYYVNTPDGLTVKKTSLSSGTNIFSLSGTIFASETRFFYSSSEEILGSYEGAVNLGNERYGIPNHSSPLINFIKSHVYNGRGASLGYNAKKGGWVTQGGAGTFTLIDRMQPLGMMWCSPRGYMYGDKFGYKAAQSLQGTNPWVTGRSYQVQPGDSWDKIAHRVYGDASYASLIAGMNGRSGSQDVLVAGQNVRIPQFIPTHNNDKTSLPFYLLLSIVYESLYPALKTPQPKQHWWQTFILIVAIAVAIFVAPEIAGALPGLVSALGGSLILSEAVIGAVVAGVIDAAGQGVLVLAGIDTFSWSYLAQAMIGGGVGAAAQAGAFNLTGVKLADIIISKGMANITQQLLEMAVGIRKQFDMKSVASSMAVAGINTQLRLPISETVQNNSPYFADAVQNAFQAVPDAFVTQEITGQKIDYGMLGVQFVAQTVGTFVGDRSAAYIHNNYDPNRDIIAYQPMKGHVLKTPVQYSQPALSQAQKQYLASRQTVEEIHDQLNRGSANQKNAKTSKSTSENSVTHSAVNPAAKQQSPELTLLSMPDDITLRMFFDSDNSSIEGGSVYKPYKASLKPISEIKAYNPGFFRGYKDAFSDVSSRNIPPIEKIRLDLRILLFGSDPMRYNDSFEPTTIRESSLGAGKTILNGVFETANVVNFYGDKFVHSLNPWAQGPYVPNKPIELYSVSKAEVLGANAVNGIFTVVNIVDGVKLAGLGLNYLSPGLKMISRDSITKEAIMRSSYLKATYAGTTSVDRMAMIDRLSYANYERRVYEMLENQEYIYRYVTNDNLNKILANGSVRGYSTTFFTHSSAEIMSRGQLDRAWYGGNAVEAMIAIPTKDITGIKLARPMGGNATMGWEVFTNSYPNLGQGKIPQFLVDTVSTEGLPYMSLNK